MFDLIFNRKTFMAVKEPMEKGKYITPGEKESLNFKPTAPAAPTSQKTDKAIGGKFVEDGDKEKLLYPKPQKENHMDKTAAQQLPGSDKIDAGSVVEKGEKEKLQFPTKPGPDPKIKMQGLDNSSEARKQVEPGEKGGVKHGPAKAKDIKIEWQVNTDGKIADQFIERGDKGDAKKVSAPAKEPGVSAQKESGADANIERGDAAKPIQKQFNLNFRKSTLEERRAAVTEAVDNALLELEVAASKFGVSIWDTPLANAYGHLLITKAGVKMHGDLYVTAGKTQEDSREALKAKYAGNTAKCTAEHSAEFCKWVESSKAVIPAPIKVEAAAKPAVDPDKAAEELGKRIF